MKFLLVAVVLLMAPLSHALVLGELKGTGRVRAEVKVDGTKLGHKYSKSCELAMNISEDADTFEFSYGLIKCGGLIYNDALPDLKKVGNKLYTTSKKGLRKQVGEIDAYGTVHVRIIDPVRTYKTMEYVPGYDCSMRNGTFRQVTFYLNSERNYKFKKSDKGWSIEFYRRSDDVQLVNENDTWCNHSTAARTTQIMNLTGILD